ncbi:MAG: DUF4835 family protein [Candidatus Neomarinimicrobiota bacterium]
MAPLPAQFGEINTVFDDRLLKDNDRQLLADLPNEIGRFFANMAWDGDFGDLVIPLHLQLIFEGTSSKGAEKTYLVQALISNGLDQRYFDKSVQFSLISSGLNYSPGFFDPLSSFLTYYGYLILAGEADTYVPNGGSQFYEICREIALRGSSSDYSKGWSERVRQVDELSTNYGLRKARLAFYYGEELFRKGELDKALAQLKDVVNGLDMVYQKTGREQNVNTFMKAHCGDLARMLGMLGQKELLLDLVELDPDNEKIYQAALESL